VKLPPLRRIIALDPSKIITVLIYMNEQWDDAGGRLRLLRSADNIDDFFAELPPVAGTMLAFKRSNNSWHGHKSFAGQRRVIQFNWLCRRVIGKSPC
jgi:Rps23 Pro-64 3,4-dihydroxylase Tpa1-like proline 4-hydroxylase